jgi:hypothetical protein
MNNKIGFEYIEGGLFPTIEIKLNGKSLSIRELVKIAEQMRVELLSHGVEVRLKDDKA